MKHKTYRHIMATTAAIIVATLTALLVDTFDGETQLYWEPEAIRWFEWVLIGATQIFFIAWFNKQAEE